MPAVKPRDAVALPVSTALMLGALFTVSWDRFGSVEIADFNLKLPTALFAASLGATMVDTVARRGRATATRFPFTFAVVALVTVYAVRASLAPELRTALLQTAATMLGAVAPFAAIYNNLRLHGGLDRALTTFIRGGYLAAIFGLYQLIAFYAGLPQVVSYTAEGGGLGRISSFSYEAGYFGYFIILVLAAIAARSQLRNAAPSWAGVTLLVVTLALANTRAAFLTVPLFLLLVLARRPSRATVDRMVRWAIVAATFALIAWLTIPDFLAFQAARAQTLLDPQEATSNAPRLFVIERMIPMVTDHFWVGIGPGHLYFEGSAYGLPPMPGASPNSTIANNIYLQALLDGGVVLLALQLIFTGGLVAWCYRRAEPVARALAGGFLAVFLPASLITSYYWDMKLWTILALAAAAKASVNPASGVEIAHADLSAEGASH